VLENGFERPEQNGTRQGKVGIRVLENDFERPEQNGTRHGKAFGVCLSDLATRERSVGEDVGDSVGGDVGDSVVAAVGDTVGEGVGDSVGDDNGDPVGAGVGDAVGAESEHLMATSSGIRSVRQSWCAGKRAAPAAQVVQLASETRPAMASETLLVTRSGI
jgi:hypothetical protein